MSLCGSVTKRGFLLSLLYQKETFLRLKEQVPEERHEDSAEDKVLLHVIDLVPDRVTLHCYPGLARAKDVPGDTLVQSEVD